MPSLDTVRETHVNLCFEALQIVSKKGHDYNREQQFNGDTLFNMKVCSMLGVVDTTTQGILVRLTDKLMRLISLTKDPSIDPQIKEESVKDTIKDSINYLVYLYCIYQEHVEAEKNDLTAMFEEPRKLTPEEIQKEMEETPAGPFISAGGPEPDTEVFQKPSELLKEHNRINGTDYYVPE